MLEYSRIIKIISIFFKSSVSGFGTRCWDSARYSEHHTKLQMVLQVARVSEGTNGSEVTSVSDAQSKW